MPVILGGPCDFWKWKLCRARDQIRRFLLTGLKKKYLIGSIRPPFSKKCYITPPYCQCPGCIIQIALLHCYCGMVARYAVFCIWLLWLNGYCLSSKWVCSLLPSCTLAWFLCHGCMVVEFKLWWILVAKLHCWLVRCSWLPLPMCKLTSVFISTDLKNPT